MKTKNNKVGMVIFITKEVNHLLKQHLLNIESLGVETTKAELAAKLFEQSLRQEISEFNKSE